MSSVAAPAPLNLARWRTPIVLITVGCVIALIAFGPRSTLGQFLSPLSFDRGWGREAFSLAIAIQNLLWGVAQPFAGAVADRFGPMRVLCFGAILYATGLAWMAQATTLVELNLSAGVLIGFGLAGCSFPMVIGALGKLVPESWRGSRRPACGSRGTSRPTGHQPSPFRVFGTPHLRRRCMIAIYRMPCASAGMPWSTRLPKNALLRSARGEAVNAEQVRRGGSTQFQFDVGSRAFGGGAQGGERGL